MARILEAIWDKTGESVLLKTEDGESIDARVLASDSGQTIANYDAGERWAAIIVTDYGDGNLEYTELTEGLTFGVTCQDEYIIKRTDNAGSLKWAENLESD